MKVEIHCIKGGVTIEAMPPEDVAAMLQAYEDGDEVLSVTLDGGASVSHVLRANVCRIDVETRE